MPDIWDFVIVGGGASGMAAAIVSAQMGDRVLLLEKSPMLGRKIAASGNGRCNLMNVGTPVYYGDPAFASSVFEHYTKEELIQFWNSAGLIVKEEDAGRCYPRTLHSSSVLDSLKAMLRVFQVSTLLQTSVSGIRKHGDLFSIDTSAGTFQGKRVLIASGGMAYPRLGGTDSGYRLLAGFGHRIIPPFPALTPICTDTKSISGLSGIRIRCSIALSDEAENKLFSTRGEVLFTDYGISGICAMQCARFIKEGGCTVHLDLADDLFEDADDLFRFLLSRKKQFADLPPEHLLNGIFLPKLSFAVLMQAKVPVRDRKTGSLTDDEILRISHKLRDYALHVTGIRGFDDAQSTAGGADCSDFVPSTMASRIVNGLHAAGEVLNVDGDCGGFNLMFAFATGILAGLNGRKTSL